MRPNFYRIGVIAAILVTASLGILYTRINGIRITTADELPVALAANDVNLGEASRLLDVCIGRFYAIIKWPVLEFLIRDCGDRLLSVLRISAFLLCAICATKFLRDALKNNRAAAIFLVLVCALLPVVVTYQPLFYNPLLWIGWAAVWLMGVVSLRPSSNSNAGIVAGLFGLALVTHEMNAVFVVWPWITRWLVGARRFRAGLTAHTVLCGVVLLVYGAIAVIFRLATADLGISYTGGTVGYDAIAAAKSLWVNSIGCLPGLELWLRPRWQGAAGPLFIGPGAFMNRIISNLSPMSIFLCGGVGWLTWLFLRSENSALTNHVRSGRIPLIWALTFMVFAPNLLLSLTEKYQVWAGERMWPYYYSWMSYIAIVMILVVALDGLKESSRSGRNTAMGAALVIALLVAMSAATSQESTEFFREYRFDHSAVPPIEK